MQKWNGDEVAVGNHGQEFESEVASPLAIAVGCDGARILTAIVIRVDFSGAGFAEASGGD